MRSECVNDEAVLTSRGISVLPVLLEEASLGKSMFVAA